MVLFSSISSSALLVKSDKNYVLSHPGSIQEKLLMSQMLSHSPSLNFLCTLVLPFVMSMHTQIKLFDSPLLCFACSFPKSPSASPQALLAIHSWNSCIFGSLACLQVKSRAVMREIGKQPGSPCGSPQLTFRIMFVSVLTALLFSSLLPL